ncbi:MAG TPA: sensor histidine kinase, partial [Ktedonobacterales bacterium]|nr:sensor histidine kinase [Ktedonobacterales bacterium]
MKSYDHIRPLCWYLLLWVCLGYLWGFLALWNNGIAAGWQACQQGQGTPERCKQLKQLLVGSAPPNAAAQPQLILPALLAFTLILLLYGLLLWLVLSGEQYRRISWLFFAAQGLLVLAVGFVTPAVGVAVPLSLSLALILEASALLKQARLVLAVACGTLLLLIMTWRQWEVTGASSVLAGMVVAVVLLVIGFLFVMGFLFSYHYLARAHTQLEAAHMQLQSSAAQIESLTLLTERQRMARELHDTLAQGLAGIILHLGVANAHLAERQPEIAQEIMQQTLASARETLANARSAIDDLRATGSRSADLVEDVQEEIRCFAAATGISCESELAPLGRVAPAYAEHLVRAISEGLRNIAQHAQARHSWVRATCQEDRLVIEVGDDGLGFDPALVAGQNGHYGLLGLRERARLIGGQLALLSAPGQGTRVQLLLPV